ncbi:oxidoreductase [Clostridia bacterium]|nr:oxidoreductase [Clostridia bacterium]
MKIGIIGAGGIASKMARTLAKMKSEGYEAYAIASRSLEKAQAFADENGVTRAYGSYEEMLADPAVELVYVATPHSLHYEHGKMSILAGKPTLIEKAFTSNAKQARELVALSKQKNVFLAEAIWTRYLPARQIITDIIGGSSSVNVGDILSLTASLTYNISGIERMYRPELSGGALLDLGVYVINFALMFLGNPVSVTSRSKIYKDSGCDEKNRIVMTFAGGETAVLYCSMTEEKERVAVFAGSGGLLVCDDTNCPQEIVFHEYIKRTPQAKLTDTLLTKPTVFRCPFEITGFEYQVRACAEAIKEGEIEPKQMPHSEIVKVMEIMDGIRKTAGVVYPVD